MDFRNDVDMVDYIVTVVVNEDENIQNLKISNLDRKLNDIIVKKDEIM